MTARFQLDKPIIAAVNGAAVGGGFEMVLACDVVVAASNSYFALPEVRVGVAALGGGILRLSRIVGFQSAMGIVLTGRKAARRRVSRRASSRRSSIAVMSLLLLFDGRT